MHPWRTRKQTVLSHGLRSYQQGQIDVFTCYKVFAEQTNDATATGSLGYSLGGSAFLVLVEVIATNERRAVVELTWNRVAN
jgi:hypothetical protein